MRALLLAVVAFDVVEPLIVEIAAHMTLTHIAEMGQTVWYPSCVDTWQFYHFSKNLEWHNLFTRTRTRKPAENISNWNII